MQKIEIDNIARSAGEGVGASVLKKSRYPRPTRLAITAAALASALLAHTASYAQAVASRGVSAVREAVTTSAPEKAARQTWRAVIRNTPVPGTGCFHVSYPNVAWVSVECRDAKPRVSPVAAAQKTAAPGAGAGLDFVAGAQGLITSAYGKFFIAGVESETNVVTASTAANSTDLILGSNEYSLQLNTNFAQTAACGDYGTCYVWQQFMYGTDYNQPGEAALFMQYWLYDWGGTCPKGWKGGTSGTCYKNSKYVALPDIPVTNLGDVILAASVENGGNDYIWLEYGDDSWVVGNRDSSAPCCGGGLDIASAWNQAEFNIVGDMNLTQAQFNHGSQITVVLQILDGSQSAPTCIPPGGTFGDGVTGESNNMTLGTCSTGVGNLIDWYGCDNSTLNICGGYAVNGPYIEFGETVPFPHLPPPVCIVCGIEAAPRAEVADGTEITGSSSLN